MTENEITSSNPATGEEAFGGWIWAGNLIRETITAKVVIAFLLGVVVGLVVLGWWLWPVQWINADPADLKPSHKESYLQMIADSYALTGNPEVARARMEALKGPGEKDADLSTMLGALIQARIKAGKADEATRLQRLASAMILPSPPMPQPTPVKPAITTISPLLRIVGIVFFLFLLGLGAMLILTQLQRREALRRRRPPPAGRPFAKTEVEEGIAAPFQPVSTLGYFETTYNLGDEGYDVSYSIESPTGEFLGECGISALEDIGIGEPEKATAFEIWLFDKDDVRTETKVLMSERAFGDEAVRERLTDKGELVKAGEGQIITLETANLRLSAVITDLAYEAGSNASVFAKLTTRLEVSQRGPTA